MESAFDDYLDPAAKTGGRQAHRSRGCLPELIADAYRRAAAPVRKRLLERLLHPVGSLALAAVASGAFGTFLLRRVTLEDVGRITAEQLAELARFVDQCNPDALRQVLAVPA
jgi:hypothetical protein